MAKTAVSNLKPSLGLSDEVQQAIVKILEVTLADEFTLYTKMRNYHWNVTGPEFHSLHVIFENQYDQLADIVDDTAERIRQFGAYAPASLKEFQTLTRLSEHPGVYPNAHTMVANALADHELLIRHLREDTEVINAKYHEIGVEDFLTGLLQIHQKAAWMLRAHLDGEGI
jgi:starvation-inducible DNA-binding protein